MAANPTPEPPVVRRIILSDAPQPFIPAVAPSPARSRRIPLLGGLLILAALAVGVLSIYNPSGCSQCGKILEFPDQGHTHIAKGEAHPAYNSDPPTSGWHREEFASSNQPDLPAPLDDEVSVHLLEHGYVIAWYSCPADDNCAQIRRQLVGVASAGPDGTPYRMYVMSRPHLPYNAKIALGAWEHLEYLDHFDQTAVQAFVKRFAGAVQEGMPAPTPTAP